MPKTSSKPALTAAILGGRTTVIARAINNNCVICHKPITAERLKALKLLNLDASRYTHTKCSTVGKIKGIYLGENGTSQLQLCDKVYNDSVRSVLRKSDEPDEEDDNDI